MCCFGKQWPPIPQPLPELTLNIKSICISAVLLFVMVVFVDVDVVVVCKMHQLTMAKQVDRQLILFIGNPWRRHMMRTLVLFIVSNLFVLSVCLSVYPSV